MKQEQIGEQEKNTPLREYRAGGVRATIWENTHTDGKTQYTIQTTTIERRYKKGDEWKSTNTYKLADIQKLKHVLTQAEAYMLTGEREEGVDA